MEAYFDNSATTRVFDSVRDNVVKTMTEDYGTILRSKGMVPDQDSEGWLHFDLVPGEFQIREGSADYTGRLCVIGAGLDEARLEKLFLLA